MLTAPDFGLGENGNSHLEKLLFLVGCAYMVPEIEVNFSAERLADRILQFWNRTAELKNSGKGMPYVLDTLVEELSGLKTAIISNWITLSDDGTLPDKRSAKFYSAAFIHPFVEMIEAFTKSDNESLTASHDFLVGQIQKYTQVFIQTASGS